MATNKNSSRFPSQFTQKSLSAAVSLALFLGLSGTAVAQNNDDEDVLLEEIVVTGTRKEGRLPTETLSPVDVISGTALQYQAASDLTDS